MESIEIRPCLPGYHFNHVTVVIDDDRVSVVSHELDGSTVERFRSRGYRPGACVSTVERMADDVIIFAMSYVERPEEFDRSADDGDIEQESANRAWWMAHGWGLSACLDIE